MKKAALALLLLAACRKEPVHQESARSAAVDAGPPPLVPFQVMAEATHNEGAIALDGDSFYFTDTMGLHRFSKFQWKEDQRMKRHSIGECCANIAVDDRHVYWSFGKGDSGLWRIGKEDAIDRKGPDAIEIDHDQVAALAIDASDIYWLRVKSRGQWALGATLMHAVKRPDGGAPEAAKAIAEVASPSYESLAVDERLVYFVSNSDSEPSGGAIRAVPRNGGTTVDVVALDGPATHLRVDGDSLLWVEKNAIRRASKTPFGGTKTIAALGEDVCLLVHGIAFDERNVYFTCDVFHPNQLGGSIWRVDKEGAQPPRKLADGIRHPMRIAVDREAVFWSTIEPFPTPRVKYVGSNVAKMAKPE